MNIISKDILTIYFEITQINNDNKKQQQQKSEFLQLKLKNNIYIDFEMKLAATCI